MPLASAALIAEVTIGVPITQASGLPPSDSTNAIARSPGSSLEPDTIAASVSSR